MLTDKEVVSLIALLDDEDEEIVKHVEDKLLSLGVDVVTLLESEWDSINNIEHQQNKAKKGQQKQGHGPFAPNYFDDGSFNHDTMGTIAMDET